MLHTLTTNKKRKKRVGRGGARGTNSGHGHKGQKSRAGHRIRPALRDELQRIPKRRGYNKNRARGVRNRDPVRSVTLTMLAKNFSKNEKVTPTILTKKRLIAPVRGKMPSVKIIATGDVSEALTIVRCAVSPAARERIEKAGGTIQ